MSNIDNYSVKDHAIAQLALQLSKSEPQNHIPSDEDLAAFYDNQLDESRRQQVLHAIANDQQVYTRWIALVESLSTSLTPNSVTSPVAVAQREKSSVQKTSFLTKLSEWWNNSPGFLSPMGSGLATAAVVVLAVILIPHQQQTNLSDDLSELYNNYGIGISSQSSQSQKPVIDSSSQRAFTFPKNRTTLEKILQTGYLAGAKQLKAEEFKQWGIALERLQTITPQQTTEMSREQYNVLFETGRLTALVTLPCLIDNHNSNTQKFLPIANTLFGKLNELFPDQFGEAIRTYDQQKGNPDALCLFVEKVSPFIY